MRKEFAQALEEQNADIALVKMIIWEFIYQHAPDFNTYNKQAVTRFRKKFQLTQDDYLKDRMRVLFILERSIVKHYGTPKKITSRIDHAH